VQKKFISEGYKTAKKVNILAKKVYIFAKKVYIIYQKIAKKVHITQTSVNLCKLSEKFTSIFPPLDRNYSMERDAWGKEGFIPISRIWVQGMGSSELGTTRQRQAYCAGN
jgi:hypothetical protein